MDIGISTLNGKTITNITGAFVGSDRIVFKTSDGCEYAMYHSQDCCESVCVNEIVGDIADLIGHPILEAEESANKDDDKPHDYAESWTWSFYKLGTIKGHVNIRWLGESNGYYSESVYFCQVPD